MSMFGENDIELVDDATKVKLPETKPPEPDSPGPQAAEEKEEERDDDYDAGYSKGNDPVRMYLRKMGSVSLLTSREARSRSPSASEEGEKAVMRAVLSSSLSIREILEIGDRLPQGNNAGPRHHPRTPARSKTEKRRPRRSRRRRPPSPKSPAPRKPTKTERIIKLIEKIRKRRPRD